MDSIKLNETQNEEGEFLRAIEISRVKKNECIAVNIEGQRVLFINDNDKIYALDNRCPHMGFPLDKGSVKDGILTCHWHDARFDVCSGGTFDLFADDVESYPVKILDKDIWINLKPGKDVVKHQTNRLKVGLEQNISLIIGKAVIELLANGVDPIEPFKIGIDFGVQFRRNGWGDGLTILTSLMNMWSYLKPEDRPKALFHGLSAVARDTSGQPPVFPIGALPSIDAEMEKLRQWFRHFVEIHNAEGAERCLASAIKGGVAQEQIADMLFAAATDHRFMDEGHLIDFTNKALETLDLIGWDRAEKVLTSLIPMYNSASRAEDQGSWRTPVDLVELLDSAFEKIDRALETGKEQRGVWDNQDHLVSVLAGDDPKLLIDELLQALRQGITEHEIARIVAYATALRIAHFHTVNEFPDWDDTHHAFTYSNAVHQAMVRAPSVELLRAVFDGAIFNYLNRFLNIPSAPLPKIKEDDLTENQQFANAFFDLLNKHEQVNQAGKLVALYLDRDTDFEVILSSIGGGLLREDRNFHSIQIVEAAFQQYKLLEGSEEGSNVLVAAARFLAAHSPTRRAQGQTYEIANKLFRGDKIYESE
ncbi:MAG: Rieske (2Fe-2S) protein [Candidatus Heimdallarchaeota archaeon]|nr:Rieske (2Fe-2S) protein [Candidatus Heimdallarchaeota archaeon]